MRLLLDTHTLLWAVGQPSKLSDQAASLVGDPANELVVSAVVPWELAIKCHLGKLPPAAPLLLGWAAALQRLSATAMSITHAHALAAGGLAWTHRDPFDRMLAAQALSDSLPVVSADEIFDTLPGIRRLW